MVSEINTYGTNNSVCIENTWQEGCLTNPLPVNNNVLFDKLLCSITPHFVFSRTTVVYVLHSVYRNLILLKHSVLLYSCISNLVLCCSNCFRSKSLTCPRFYAIGNYRIWKNIFCRNSTKLPSPIGYLPIFSLRIVELIPSVCSKYTTEQPTSEKSFSY